MELFLSVSDVWYSNTMESGHIEQAKQAELFPYFCHSAVVFFFLHLAVHVYRINHSLLP